MPACQAWFIKGKLLEIVDPKWPSRLMAAMCITAVGKPNSSAISASKLGHVIVGEHYIMVVNVAVTFLGIAAGKGQNLTWHARDKKHRMADLASCT